MAETLTPQQKMAVTDRGGKLLVSAAAGSGKTKVLVDRLLSYLTQSEDPANIDDFLMITYTKAAASELRGKIAQKLTERLAADPGNRHLQQQMQRLYLAKISTVHAFCGDILREYAYSLDLSGDFRVAEENECRLLQQQVLEGAPGQSLRGGDGGLPGLRGHPGLWTQRQERSGDCAEGVQQRQMPLKPPPPGWNSAAGKSR